MPHFLKMDEGSLEIVLIVHPYFMVFNHGFNSACPAPRVQGQRCFLAVWFHGYSTFRFGRSFVLFGFDDKAEAQKMCVTLWGIPLDRNTVSGYWCVCMSTSARRDLSVLNTNDIWTGVNDGREKRKCYSKVCVDFFPLQKVVISHFDWGVKSHSVPLGPQKYQHAPDSHVWRCHG